MDIDRVVAAAAKRLMAAGAKAVLLTGSHARGTARPDSDIDLFVVGDGPEEDHELVDGTMLSTHWWTEERARQRMTSPATAFVAVFAWRDAVIVEDPLGVAAELKAVADAWSWDDFSSEADAWVADRVVGLAEYAMKLRRALDDDRQLDTAALRAQLALGLAEVGAVVNRVTSQSENGLWETVAASGDPTWRDLLCRAFGSAEATLELYDWLADAARPILQPRQLEIVDHAQRASSGRALHAGASRSSR